MRTFHPDQVNEAMLVRLPPKTRAKETITAYIVSPVRTHSSSSSFKHGKQ